MRQLVRLENDADGIARIIMDNPPVNALSHLLRIGIAAALEKAAADPAVKAILLTAAGRTFPAGLSVSELEHAPKDPSLSELCDRIEMCAKPVIAAINGTALGGGYELALAAHYRIAAPGAHVGLPEISLGLLPGAGGTQRLPRLVGPKVALEMMLVGRPVAAEEAARLGLIDRVAAGDLLPAAQAFAQEVAGAAPRRSRDQRTGIADAAGYQATIRQFRSKAAQNPIPAAGRIIDAVEAAQLLPFEAGLAFEAAAFEDCVKDPSARALRHVFMAERNNGTLPEAEGAKPRGIVRVAIIGTGPSMTSWAVCCLDGGLQVSLHTPGAADRVAAEAQIAEIYDQAVAKGRLADGLRGERIARLAADAGREAIGQADLVILAPAGDAAAAEAEMRPGAVLALAVGPGQAPDFTGLQRPGDALGFQAQGAAHTSRLVEVLTGADAAPDVLATATRLMARLGKIGVFSPAEEGGIGGAIWGGMIWAVEEMMAKGAAPAVIEKALRGYGFTLMPGDVLSGPAGTWTRDFSEAEICQRCLAAMANVGALLVQAGAARRPADVDLVAIHGYGFPRWRGGPMMVADLTGLMTVMQTLKVLAGEDPDFWAPAGLFADLIKNGRKLADLNG
ncbi:MULTISPECIES: enoyl-CoA hydratase-related protein [Actibacterium]|uniref:3-hydroxyacyl-CoA dehydrogenase n=1 Tax=Actibacterium naphthalenivorans TaxID=1614693 RepID=A0A840CMS3_9RHOB|nr:MULTISPECIES: enoyl-CoA hydratase-related protein [Actibacterium]ALG90919.1 hypothetical protein TQ29_12955 [Actibacterium sp. EMB200-NS6]MBB4023287.1 3-hydroxyacyl-CoA dehydrogenase [Actibacterium naphthalenivorans]